MKFFDALACLLLAGVVGLLFMTCGLDLRGGEWPIYPAGVYILIVVYAAPSWLFTFVPVYLIAGSQSLVWRWYIAPTKYEFYDFPRECFAPLIIGFATFFFGAVLKRLSLNNPSFRAQSKQTGGLQQ
jgi:hypothetical protein